MKKHVLAAGMAGAALALAGSSAFAAAPPKFTASCPAGLAVSSNGSGKVEVNGKGVAVQTLSSTSWRSVSNGVTVDMGRDGAQVFVSTTPGDICQVTSSSAAPNADGSIGGVPRSDQKACLKAVKRKTRNTVVVLTATSAEANNNVTIGVGPDKAKWQCLVKKGRVAEVMSLTDEGAQ